MPITHIVKNIDVVRTARVMQLEGIFDVSPSEKSSFELDADLPIDTREWNIGLITGPSGCGKSLLANNIFPDNVIAGYEWDSRRSIVDCFPADKSIKEICTLLSSVGFSSPPSWLRPYHVLSTGEQFRVTMARILTEDKMTVLDEFTSVIDRTVAQIGSAAVAKAIRHRNKKFVAVSCHHDIIEWLQPDWVYQPHLHKFQWRCLQRFPAINLAIQRCDKSAWELFKKHHYLDTSISPLAQCYVALIQDIPVAFTSVIYFPHPSSPGWKGHRTVCLPDFQGVGIGNRLAEVIAAAYSATGKPYRSTTGNPAMIAHRAKSDKWRMITKPSRQSRGDRCTLAGENPTATRATDRLVASFQYVGLPDKESAIGWSILPAATPASR